MNRYSLAILSVALFAAGCSSSKNTSANESPPYYLGAFEDFDDGQLEDVIPPLEDSSVEHEVPAKLQSRAGTGSTQTRGFRVQVFSSLSRSEANEVMQKAITWWEDQSDRRSARPPVYMEYEQPYYKVRAGNFTSRDSASKMVVRLGRVFAGAFIVPSMIERGK